MTKFRDGFMMKSPLPKHDAIMAEMQAKSKESSGRDDAPDFSNAEVVKLKKDYDKAKAEHDSAAKMTEVQPIDASAYFVAPDQMDYSDMIAAAGKMGAQKSKRAKDLDAIQNPNGMGKTMTRGEARKQRRKNKKN